MIVFGTFQVEIANRFRGSRTVGIDWVVTRRPVGRTCILACFETREEAEMWARAQAEGDTR